MALVLDSSELAPELRGDAFKKAFSSTGLRYQLSFGPAAQMRHKVYSVQLSLGVRLLQTRGSSFRIYRGPKEVRAAAPERLSLALQVSGTGSKEHNGQQTIVRPGDLSLVDQTQMNDFRSSQFTEAKAVIIDYQLLELNPEEVRLAVPNVGLSPLAGLLRNHLTFIDIEAGGIDSADLRDNLSTATVSLVRALVLSAQADDIRARAAIHETLIFRIDQFIAAHLNDSEMSVGTIARAHHVSVRHLYNIWTAAGNAVPIAEAILQRRLELSRIKLASPRGTQSVASVAGDCGFADATHFARRFRAAYGCTPSEWRQAANH